MLVARSFFPVPCYLLPVTCYSSWMPDLAVNIRGITKSFRLSAHRSHDIKTAVLHPFQARKPRAEPFQALRGIVVIDEIQRLPELFPVLRVLVDRPRPPARFLVLGSASPGLLRQGSETITPRRCKEVQPEGRAKHYGS